MCPSPSANRLPIDHPDFQYPASKNPYWTKVKELQGRIYSDNDTESHREKWRGQFLDHDKSSQRELHVELGCNAGHVVLEWAARNPKAAYIGLDWKFKPIYRAAEKAAKRGISNVLFLRAHAERLRYMFGEGEIDRLYLFFPDPWPKKAHWKNRFLTAQRLRELAPLLKKTGVFHIKTDHPGYFEWMEDALREASDFWSVLERSTDLHAGHPAPGKLEIPEVTLFEKLFIKDGIKIHSLKLKPR